MSDGPARLTGPQRRALTVLRDAKEPLPPSLLADRLWPEKRSRMSNVGASGAAAGVGGNLSAGAFLSRLRRMGLVVLHDRDGFWTYSVSEAGRAALDREARRG